MRLLHVIASLSVLFSSLIQDVHTRGLKRASVEHCPIKKLIVRVTRVAFDVYGDKEPPVTTVLVNYYDPTAKEAKTLGTTNINSNGRSMFPVWNETDGTIESDDDVELYSDLALEFVVFCESERRKISPNFVITNLRKFPILNAHGVESIAELHTLILHHHANTLFWPKGNKELCTLNHLTTAAFPAPAPNCVYGHIYFFVFFEKTDPECDDESRETTKTKKYD